MTEHRYSGLLGHVSEASDIHAETGCTIDQAFEAQGHLAAHREQEYLDSIAEIEESNVVYGVSFGRRGK
jgi:hypothetical protein